MNRIEKSKFDLVDVDTQIKHVLTDWECILETEQEEMSCLVNIKKDNALQRLKDIEQLKLNINWLKMIKSEIGLLTTGLVWNAKTN